MRNVMGVLLFMGLGGGSLAAQVGRSPGCPVEFQAAVSSRVLVRSVTRGETATAAGPLVELRFGQGAKRVVAANVVVHGFSSDGRVLPVTGGVGQVERTREQQERFELRAVEQLRLREVQVREMRVVQWAELQELRYADGSMWRQTRGESCKAVPSGFHLVGEE